MNKIKNIQKIELIVMTLILVYSVIILSIHAMQEVQKEAEKFTWQKIKGTMPEVLYFSNEEMISVPLPRLDASIRTPEDYAYGVIAVVKVKKSRNYLATWQDSARIHPRKLCSSAPELRYLGDVRSSRIMTDAEILEVLYQSPGAVYHRGQTVQLRENYFIVDQRVPNILRSVWERYFQEGTEASTVPEDAYIVLQDEYVPLQEGEIYLIYTRIARGESYNLDYYKAWATEGLCAMICLSSPELKAGNSIYAHEGFQWVTEKYDLSKYLK